MSQQLHATLQRSGFALDEWWDYILDAARRYSNSHYERDDIAGDAARALLAYDRPIECPQAFIDTTLRHLAINRSKAGASMYEVSEVDAGAALENLAAATRFPEQLIVRDSLQRLLDRLSPRERECYELLRRGYEQRDLPQALGVSRQASAKLLKNIRRKFETQEQEDLL